MSTEEEKDFDVFLSHSHEDAEWVEELAKRLEDSAKLRVWLDKWILVPGKHWQQEMACGLNQAKTCAVCIGEKTPEGWFKEEIEKALNRQQKDKFFRVIPVLLPKAQTVNVNDFLEMRTWVDFKNDLDNKRAFHLLVSGIQGVAPGRGLEEEEASEQPQIQVRDELKKLKQYRKEEIVDEVVAQEYQRKLLDMDLLKRGGQLSG